MNQRQTFKLLHKAVCSALLVVLLFQAVKARPRPVWAAPADVRSLPVVAIHVSELTRELETMQAAGTDTPQPPITPGASGYQWFVTAWHYFVPYSSLMEALRSDGTPFVTINDAEISAGRLLLPDGSPKYPIVISLAAEAIADVEITPLKSYVKAGGFLLVGSSAFTRYPDGATRGDFALADEMGVHMQTASLTNWTANQVFTKVFDHRLVAHIPRGNLHWYMPLAADEIYWGTVYSGHYIQGDHYQFRVVATDATVLAKGRRFPILTFKNYGKGTFIYHADLQPLLGFGGNDAGMYAYGIYRNAIEWAFETADLPIIKLSPWRYPFDAAFIIRHDLENTSGEIIESSAKAEFEAGARGDYYFCTGVLREQMKNNPAIIASLRRAVVMYGASIGPHNGGLKNPNNPNLTYANVEYWHWGPDEALNGTQAGFDYALKSIQIAYQDIDRWLAGVDNGRPGCGAAGNCPHIWVSPYFNSAREDSNVILEKMDAVSMGEQKISPFPHYTLSTSDEYLLYPQVSLPVSDWFIEGRVAQSIEAGHTIESVRSLVDAYYQMGALINLYGHTSSASGLLNEYMLYSLSKPRIWASNSVSIADWWALRSRVIVTPAYTTSGLKTATATLHGASDPETAIEMVFPKWNPAVSGNFQVLLDGVLASSDQYRVTQEGIKVKAGGAVSKVEVRFIPFEAVLSPEWCDRLFWYTWPLKPVEGK